MRTTLTIDDDVAVQLKRLRRERDMNLKELVNEVLRRGLRDMSAASQKKASRTRAFDLASLSSTSTTWLRHLRISKAKDPSDSSRPTFFYTHAMRQLICTPKAATGWMRS